MQYLADGISGAVYTGSNLTLSVVKAVKPQNFSIINHNYRPPIMIVTRMCANLIIRKIYKDGSPSVKVALSQHYNGSERPCKRFLRVRIYIDTENFTPSIALYMRRSVIVYWNIHMPYCNTFISLYQITLDIVRSIKL